jgi:hypothetical protein
MRTHIQRKGHFLVANTYLSAAGKTKFFTARVDLRPIARAVVRYHKLLHARAKVSGCVGCDVGALTELSPGYVQDDVLVGFSLSGTWKSIGRTVKKVGKSKLLKKISRGAKSVVRSKVTGAILGSAAVVFPPVGAPALAAYATANAALRTYENGRTIVRSAKKAARSIKLSHRVKGALKTRLFGSAKVRAKRAKLIVRANARLGIKGKSSSFLAKQAAQARARRLAQAGKKPLTLAMARAKAAKRYAAGAKKRAAMRRKTYREVYEKTKARMRKAKAKAAYRKRLERARARLANPKTARDKKVKAIVARAKAKMVERIKERAKQKAKKIPLAQRRKAAKIIAKGKSARRVAKTLAKHRKPALRAVKQKKVVQKEFQKIAINSRYAQDPARKAHYQKVARILNIAAKNREKLRDIAHRSDPKARKGTTGLVINSQGKILEGQFVADTAAKNAPTELLYAAKGKTVPGRFKRVTVGGCIGCT